MTDTRTDEQLATLAAQGDTAARNTFIERHIGLIRFHCGKCCGDRADEYVSYAFEYVGDRLSKYDGSCDPKTAAFNFLPHWLVRMRRRNDRLIRGVVDFHQMPEQTAEIMRRTGYVQSLSDPYGKIAKWDLASQLVDRPETPEPLSPIERQAVHAIMDSLDDIEYLIVVGRLSGRTLEQVGNSLGFTREYIRQRLVKIEGLFREIAVVSGAVSPGYKPSGRRTPGRSFLVISP